MDGTLVFQAGLEFDPVGPSEMGAFWEIRKG
jgi:hypothetical protein